MSVCVCVFALVSVLAVRVGLGLDFCLLSVRFQFLPVALAYSDTQVESLPPPPQPLPPPSLPNKKHNRAQVLSLQAENGGLKQALGQAQEALGAYDRDNKILKRGVAVQNGKIERFEAELESLRAGNRQALEHIGRLEQVGG
jgi:hypothetical protein